MGDIKHKELKQRRRGDHVRDVTSNGCSCLSGTIWTVSILTLVGVFSVLNYLQFAEILKLKQRLDYLEIEALNSKDEASLPERTKRQRENNDVTEIVHDIISKEMQRYRNKSLSACPQVRLASGCGKGPIPRALTAGQACCDILAKPSVQGNSTEIVTSYIGQDIILPCRSSGYPPPTVTYSTSVDPTERNRYVSTPIGLTILNAQISDRGTYICSAENIFGKQYKRIVLRVIDPVVVTTAPTAINVRDGGYVHIQCDATGNPPPLVTWQHTRPDGVTVPVINTSKLTITANSLVINGTAASDAGSYTCFAQNQFEKDQASTSVIVIGKPEIVQPPRSLTVLQGTTVTLDCSVVSNPPATVTWTYPLTGIKAPLNARVNPDNSVILSGVDKYNNGVYRCKAANSYGTAYAQSTLVVEKETTVSTTPHLQPLTGTEPVLNFQCTSDGDPKPTTLWSKVGAAPLAGNSKYLALSGGNLIITGPDLVTDTGIYTCFGQNSHGNATDSVVVYRALGQINCTVEFADVGCLMGQICGGTCPNNCNFQGQVVYGYQTYTSGSGICMAGTHSGVHPNPNNNPIIWQHVASGIFNGVISNGIKSQSHASSDANQIVRQPSSGGSTAGHPLIG